MGAAVLGIDAGTGAGHVGAHGDWNRVWRAYREHPAAGSDAAAAGLPGDDSDAAGGDEAEYGSGGRTADQRGFDGVAQAAGRFRYYFYGALAGADRYGSAGINTCVKK